MRACPSLDTFTTLTLCCKKAPACCTVTNKYEASCKPSGIVSGVPKHDLPLCMSGAESDGTAAHEL